MITNIKRGTWRREVTAAVILCYRGPDLSRRRTPHPLASGISNGSLRPNTTLKFDRLLILMRLTQLFRRRPMICALYKA